MDQSQHEKQWQELNMTPRLCDWEDKKIELPSNELKTIEHVSGFI